MKIKKEEKKHNNIGIDANSPEHICNDDKCPWHGHLRIRGRIFKAKVVSSKGFNTAIAEWNFYRYIPKYERSERRKTRVAVHNPACISAKTGDIVRIGECRPISKTKRLVIFEKLNQV